MDFRFLSDVSMSIFPAPCLHVHVFTFPEFRNPQTENGTFRLFSADGKANFHLFAANGNRKRTFVFHG
jgi:hypothetical protein